VFGGKIGVNAGYGGSGSGQSGTYDITTAVGLITDPIANVMFVFKDGGSTTLVGYLIDLVDGLTGTWSTPFLNPPFGAPGDGSRDTSHISVYFQEGTSVVPLPAALPLFGGALGILGLLGWRKRRIAAAA
jgi:hypothetical protein